MSTKILVLYYSRQGSVRQLASSVSSGIESVDGCETLMRTLPPVSAVNEAVEKAIPDSGDVYCTSRDLERCDGLVLGSPTRFGTVASPIKYFFDQNTSLWMSGGMAGKPAGVFTSTTSMHGGQESTLLSMMLPLIHHGMLMIGIPFAGTRLSSTNTGGSPYGASHVAGSDGTLPVSSDESSLARLLGQRIARCARALDGVRP